MGRFRGLFNAEALPQMSHQGEMRRDGMAARKSDQPIRLGRLGRTAGPDGHPLPRCWACRAGPSISAKWTRAASEGCLGPARAVPGSPQGDNTNAAPHERREGTTGPETRLDLEGAGGHRKRRKVRQSCMDCRYPHGTYSPTPGSPGRGKRAGARSSPQNAAIDGTPSRLCIGGWLPIPKAALQAIPPAPQGACASGSHPFTVRA